MPEARLGMSRQLLANCLNWFLPDFNQSVVLPLQGQFPNHPLPAEVLAVTERLEQLIGLVSQHAPGDIEIKPFVEELLAQDPGRPPLFKQAILRYRRFRVKAWGNLPS